MALSIGELVGYLDLKDTDFSRKMVENRAKMKAFAADLPNTDGFENGLKKVGTALVGVGAGMFTLKGLAASLGPQLLAMVAPTLPALLIMPGAIAAIAGAMITWKLGADGVKKAFEALTPTLDKLKANVSATFEKGMAPAVQNLKGIIPQLTSGFQGVAGAISGVAVKFTEMLKQKASVVDLQAILNSSKLVVQNLGAAFAPIVQALLDIASVGANTFQGLTEGAGGLAQRFADFIRAAKESGQLHDWMQGGIEAIKSLVAFFGQLGSIVVGVFSALHAGGMGIGSWLGPAVTMLDAFVHSAEGQAAFTALGSAIALVGNTVSTVLKAALEAIAPVIPPLIDAFTQLIEGLPWGALTDALGLTGQLLGLVARFLAENMSWIEPLAIGYAILTAATWLLNYALDANPIGVVIIALVALVAVVQLVIENWSSIAGFFTDLWNTIWKWTSDRISDIRDFIVNTFNNIVSFFSGLGSSIATAFMAVLDWFASLPMKIGAFLLTLPGIVGNALLSAMQWGLNAIVQGVEWIIAAAIALPLRIIEAVATFGPMIVQWAIDAFVSLIATVVEWIVQLVAWFQTLPDRIIQAVVVFAIMLRDWIVGAFIELYNAAVQKAAELIDWVRGLPGRIVDGIRNLANMLGDAARNAWNAFKDGAVTVGSALLDWVRSIPGWIMDRLGDLGNLLLGAGKAIINGLLNGIKAAAGAVWDFVSGIGDKIASLKGPLPYDKTLLIPAGLAIMAGLHNGLVTGLAPVLDMVSGVADQLVTAFGGPTLSVGVNGAGASLVAPNGATGTPGDSSARPLVHIDNYHPPADASPDQVAVDLDWLAKSGGK